MKNSQIGFIEESAHFPGGGNQPQVFFKKPNKFLMDSLKKTLKVQHEKVFNSDYFNISH